MTLPSTADAHLLVSRFLEHYGYSETLASFRREAGRLASMNMDSPANDNQELNAERLASHLSHLQLNGRTSSRLPQGDSDFFTTLNDTYSQLHTTNILATCVDPASRILATSATDKTVKLHNLTTIGTITSTFEIYTHHDAPVLSIDFHPLYTHIMLTTSMDGSAVLVDTFSGDVVQRFKDHQRYVVRGAFSNKGDYFATASYDHTLCIYQDKRSPDNNDVSPCYELIGKFSFLGNVETICFASSVLVAGIQNDNYLHMIRLQDVPYEERKLNMNANGDDWVSFSPTWISYCPAPGYENYLLVSTDHDTGRILLLDTLTGQQIQNYYVAPCDNKFITRRHIFHPSGLYFYVIGGDDNTVKVVETSSGHIQATLDGAHDRMIRTITLSATCLYTAGFDHKVALWSKTSTSDTDLIR
ncbi:WD40-repeat-containing domain protein [Halteromyces radiatus]|uniref:WD40-repeat-containing domain protein n=1 Tax=Halteromyces radiatus TaxID=101107 RepID=UPI00221FFC10|nr:WD40-repeat-containing domain protein [Halteromyces radiatus]KAI8089256.1 WD40-repeat-containing domain protein [Halteromyces radiatus]